MVNPIKQDAVALKENSDVDELVTEAHQVISTYSEQLEEASAQRYDLSKLLAAVLHAAASKNDKGRSVVGEAKAWLDHLLLPMLYMNIVSGNGSQADRSGAQTPTAYSTARALRVAANAEQEKTQLRLAVSTFEFSISPRYNNVAQVAKRENDRCAITGAFDGERATALFKARRSSEVPRGAPGLARMVASRILPLDIAYFADGKDSEDLGHRQRAGSFVPFTVILNGELVVATKLRLALMPESWP
ncbi:hypothetical protein DFH09DRAFT_1304897 [Mycena vulgaris]|nr:hypothetical protein DFH09DRAFT_1304897 [Mycena vulgaris]